MGKNRGNGLVGLIFFLLIVVGPNISGPIANALSQATGMNIDRSMVMVGLVVLAVVASVFNSVIRRATRPGGGPGSPQAPAPTMARTSPSMQAPGPTMPGPTMQAPRTPAAQIPSSSLPNGGAPMPTPPQFEPIINPRVLIFGIVGLLIFGGFFLLALIMSGSI